MPTERPSRRPTRSQLPDEFTPEAVRALDVRTARLLARPNNGILRADEQIVFDRALRQVLQDSTDRLGRSLGKARRSAPPSVDPELRRSYLRTQHRLSAQAERARQAFPQLTEGWELDETSTPDSGEPTAIDRDPADDVDLGEEEDISLGTFETEIEQTSDTLELLGQIAAIQQQQLEHQRGQLLSETRGLFFALAVSVAVIVAGVAPLVEATAHERRLILLWTAIVCVVAGLAYAAIRAAQSRPD